MPDLTIEFHWQCQSVEGWSVEIPSNSGGNPYTVRYSPLSAGHAGYSSDGWYCPCKRWSQFRKECSHMKAAQSKWCGWNEMFNRQGLEVAGESGNRLCPKCGLPAESRGHGV